MRENRKDKAGIVTRRQALAATATFGAALALRGRGRALAEARIATVKPGAKVCILTPEAMAGPFYFDPGLVRTDITEGRPGAPLELTLQVVEAGDCARIQGARVDLWQCDALGLYSGYADQATGSSQGETFLRGTQFTGADGEARFDTIYPGWYSGRTPHIHFKVFLDETSLVTGQLYFPDPISERIYADLPPYRAREGVRETFNANDFIFMKQGGADTVATVEEMSGKAGAFRAALVIGVDRAGRPA
jgi:protocatechuate 3,4-dioxygenase beta subunit